MVRVANVLDTDASILVGGEDQFRTLEAAGPVLMHVVGPEMAADRDVVPVEDRRALVGRVRHVSDSVRVPRIAHINDAEALRAHVADITIIY
jgi:hypothetical protein